MEDYLQYNDNTRARGLFYQAMEAALHASLEDDLTLEEFLPNLNLMFGQEVMDAVVGSINGSVRFTA